MSPRVSIWSNLINCDINNWFSPSSSNPFKNWKFKPQVCTAGPKSCLGGTAFALHPNILQLSGKSECVHEREELKKKKKNSCGRWGLRYSMFLSTARRIRNVSMCQRSFCITDDKLQLPGEQLLVRQQDSSSIYFKKGPEVHEETWSKNTTSFFQKGSQVCRCAAPSQEARATT